MVTQIKYLNTTETIGKSKSIYKFKSMTMKTDKNYLSEDSQFL